MMQTGEPDDDSQLRADRDSATSEPIYAADAPVVAYPNPPAVSRSKRGFGSEARYVVPLNGAALIDVVRAAVLDTPRLFITELTESAAHIGNRTIMGLGKEWLVLKFDDVAGKTMISAIDRNPVGVVDTYAQHLHELLQNIADRIPSSELSTE